MAEENWFLQINKAKDMDNLEDIEKKHLPIIDCQDSVKKGEPFEVTISVGKLLKHPNENSHYIEWIELFAEDLFISKVDLIPVVGNPKVTLTVSLHESHKLTAKARCSLHGIWEYSKEVKVE
ncbi:MAG: class II SORL domain-containing protein [Nanoarchaeota archaeon]|nr:class II SORL domain-containing protein [Nanoarchaeota archaeon]